MSGLDEPAGWGAGRVCPSRVKATRLRSLYDFLRAGPESRCARGVRHRLATGLAIAAAGKLAGARGPVAMAELAARLSPRQLAAARAFRSPTKGCLVPPSKSSIHRILSALAPDALDQAVRRWTASRRGCAKALALDGKSKPLNRPGGKDPGRMLIAAVEHGSGVIRGQTASDGAGCEITGVRRLLRKLGVAGRTVTLDALPSCPKTTRAIVQQGGDYVLPAKGNRPTLYDDIRRFNFAAAESHRTLDKGHGRIEERRGAVLPLDDVHGDIAALPGRRQAFRITRHRTILKTGRTSVQVAYGLTSLPPRQAGPAEILALTGCRIPAGLLPQIRPSRRPVRL